MWRKKVKEDLKKDTQLRLEELEPRILFSADGFAGDTTWSQTAATSVLLKEPLLPISQYSGVAPKNLTGLTFSDDLVPAEPMQVFDRDAIELYALESLEHKTLTTNEYAEQPRKQTLKATFTVDTVDDTPDAAAGDGLAQDSNGNTSLRAAIMHANELGGAHTIILPAGTYGLLRVDGGTDENLGTIGDLDITADITLEGAGAGQTIIPGSAGFDDRIIDVRSGSISISSATISKGSADLGGGIRISSSASVQLSNVLLDTNSASEGGAIYSAGALNVVDSEISDNTASTAGGGLHAGGNTTLQRTVLHSNGSAGEGGGIYRGATASGSLSISNVTLSGNTASANGGGLWSAAATSISSSTFTQNSADVGGGIFQEGATAINVFNTMIADNSVTSSATDVSGTVLSMGGNLVGRETGASGFSLALGDLLGTNASPLQPEINATLSDNGGNTLTHALNSGSPAINAGQSSGAPTLDQRGLNRDAQPDIGAFEHNADVEHHKVVVDTVSDEVDGTVTSIADLNANPGSDGRISLREAIIAANATPNDANPDVIWFDIADALSNGFHTLLLDTTALPAITDAVEIDGTSDNDFINSPVIQIDGNNVVAPGLVLAVGSSGSGLRALNIVNFGSHGIDIQSDNNRIKANHIGTDNQGLSGNPNGGAGIHISGSNNQVGNDNGGNLIAFNNDSGIKLSGVTATGNRFSENRLFSNSNAEISLNSGNAARQAPLMSAATMDASNQLSLTGSFTDIGAASQNLRVEYFSDTGGSAEARAYLGSDTVSTNAAGVAVVQSSFTSSLSPGAFVTATITDQNGNTSALGNSIEVLALNSAPTLTSGVVDGGSTPENTTISGELVSAVLSSVGAADADGNTLGLAVESAAGNGAWQYSTDSSNGFDGQWTNFPAVSSTDSLLLSNSSWIRYAPNNSGAELSNLVFRAWDGSNGTAASAAVTPSTANPNGGGGASAFSQNTAQLSVTVTDVNTLPTALFTVSDVAEGGILQLDASASSDPDGSIVSYEWDLNSDGSIDATGRTADIPWSILQQAGIDDGGTGQNYDVTLTVTDDSGGESSDEITFNMENVAATITISGPNVVQQGVAQQFTFSATDPGDDTITEWRIDWGDGTIQTISGASVSANHSYAVGGLSHQLVVSATDEDGTSTSAGLFITADSGVQVLEFDAISGVLERSLGDGFSLSAGTGAIIGPDGLLYVVGDSTFNVERYNPDTGQFVDEFITDDSTLNNPSGIAFGPNGNLFIADGGINAIFEFDGGNGQLIGRFVDSGPLDGRPAGLTGPIQLTFHSDGLLYVSDTLANEILRFDADTGAYVDAFVSEADNGGLFGPGGFTIGPDGHLYVASFGRFMGTSWTSSVLRFNGDDGSFMDTFIAPGDGGLAGAIGVQFAPDGNLLVGSRFSNNILRYDGETGAFIDEFIASGTGGLADPRAILFRSPHLINVNKAPTAVIAPSDDIAEGESIRFIGTGSSDSDGNIVRYDWDIGNDGTIDASGSTPLEAVTFSWATLSERGVDDDGTYQIALHVYDNNNGSHTHVSSFSVTNVAPTITVSGADFANTGSAYTLNLLAEDPGNDTVSEWRIDWGDGNIERVTTNTASHTYNTVGVTHSILVSAIDEDGAWFNGDVFVSNDATSPIFRLDGVTGQVNALLGSSTELQAALGVTIGPDGLLYAAGFNSRNVQRFDPANNQLIDTFIATGEAGNGVISNIAFGPDGNLYLADFTNSRILRFDGASGTFMNEFIASGAGGLNGPADISFEVDGNLYVSSLNNNQILRYNASTGVFVDAFVGAANNASLDGPVGFVFGPDGNLYVASSQNNEILRFSGIDGSPLDASAFVPTGTGGLDEPFDLLFAPNGELLVSSSAQNTLLRFNANTGAPLGQFIDPGASGLSSPRLLAITPDKQVQTKALPTIDNYSSEVEKTVEDTEVSISFTDLLRVSNASDEDGSIAAFLVDDVFNGSVLIGSSRATAQPYSAATNNSLAIGQTLFWTPAPDQNGLLTAFAVRVVDNEAFTSSSQAVASIQVEPVNDAPLLTSTELDLGVTDATTPSTGIQIESLLAGISSDIDSVQLGIAATPVNGNGHWQYSENSSDGTDGNWTDFPPLDSSPSPGEFNAVLLGDQHWLRYVPLANETEIATISIAAWDGSFGASSTAVTLADGKNTAFSVMDATAQLQVVQANTPPQLNLNTTVLSIAENTDLSERLLISEITVIDEGLGNNVLTLAGRDADKFELQGTSLYLRAGLELDYEQLQELQLSVRVDDASIGSTPDNETTLEIQVQDINEAPVISAVLTELSENADSRGGVVAASLMATDPDANESLSFRITSGADQPLFRINDNNELLLDDGFLDYERQASYEVFVEVSDAAGNSDLLRLEIQLADEIEITAVVAEEAAEENRASTSPEEPQADTNTSTDATEKIEETLQEETAIEPTEKTEEDSAADNEADEPLSTPSAASASLEEQLERDTLNGRSRAAAGVFNGEVANAAGAQLTTGSVTAMESLTRQEITQNNSPTTIDLDKLLLSDEEYAPLQNDALLSGFDSFSAGDEYSYLDNSSFQQGLDTMRDSLQLHTSTERIVIGSSVTVTTGVSIGYVLWLIRGSVLLSTVLSSLPAWRLIDPLPVLGGMLENANEEDDESLETILENAETSGNEAQVGEEIEQSERPTPPGR